MSSPLIGPDKTLPEITLKALLLGIILSALLAAANAYIGLLVGLTVSASIPAAALSMGILRLFPTSNILENNMVQTAASAGESLVAGIIFTIPALVLMNAWQGYNYWPLVSIALLGGVMGVAFTIPLRRALIVEAQLTFPEGVATAEVLKTGGIETSPTSTDDLTSNEHQQGFYRLLQTALIGAGFKLFESGFGLLASGISTVKSLFGGALLISANITLSPALIGVGYIIGLNIAILVFIGGVIGTLVGVPLNFAFNSDALIQAAGVASGTSWQHINAEQWQHIADSAWSSNRRIGVGAMMVGGLWSLISLTKPLWTGIKSSFAIYRQLKSNADAIKRTELDTPLPIVGAVLLLSTIPLFFIFYVALESYPERLTIASVMTVLMLVFGFIFSSVAGYMAGLVGSSNNPISGVTIATVIISSLLLLQLMGNQGLAATLGPMAVIYLAGLICSAAAIAGDNMQDLKCGHLLGATPWRQQVFQVVGVVSAAFVIPWVLQILDAGYGIGRPAPGNTSGQFLSAPQAGLMHDLSTGIFGAGIEWNYIYLGFVVAILIIVLDKIQQRRGSNFRLPVLAVAVGIYLPMGLSVPIFIGGLLANHLSKKSKRPNNNGILMASGLITGEAIMGVVIAIWAAFVAPLPATSDYGDWLGGTALLLIVVYFYRKITQDSAGKPT